MITIEAVREYFRNELYHENFTEDRNGGKTIEMIGASFIADEEAIFGQITYNLENWEFSAGIRDYEISDGYKSDKLGEQTQFFQVISIEKDQLIYTAYTATGNEYDRAVITKDFSSGIKTLK